MIEENLSETVRRYYFLRYAVIGIVLLSSIVILGVTLTVRSEVEREPPREVAFSQPEAIEDTAALAKLSSPAWVGSSGLIAGGLLLLFGVSYATYTRLSIPGFIRGYVEEQAPFWRITRRYHDFTIRMNGTSILVRFFPKMRSRWGALRIELPLSTRAHSEQVRRICEQNGVRFSEADNLVSTIATPEELNWKLLMFFRIARQIEALRKPGEIAIRSTKEELG